MKALPCCAPGENSGLYPAGEETETRRTFLGEDNKLAPRETYKICHVKSHLKELKPCNKFMQGGARAGKRTVQGQDGEGQCWGTEDSRRQCQGMVEEVRGQKTVSGQWSTVQWRVAQG